MIYLASAYSFDRERGYQLALDATIALIKRGDWVLSPVVHNHPIAVSGRLPKGWDNWKHYDLHLLDCSDELWVVKDLHERWTRSKGVSAEIAHAQSTGKTIRYVTMHRGEASVSDTP